LIAVSLHVLTVGVHVLHYAASNLRLLMSVLCDPLQISYQFLVT